MNKNLIALAGSLAIIALSCSKKSEDALAGPGIPVCDTVNMKYAANVVPILTANCYKCHGANSNTGSGGIILESYDNLKIKADNGQLIGAITHADGFPAMPKDAPKLSDCDINIIRSWINNGTNNN
jgi:mono/diheme cytochrome c family protein